MGLISNGSTIFDNGSMASGFGGSLVFLSKQTASASSSISFTSGIDSTYKEYLFTFNNIHPATDNVFLGHQADVSGGSSYAQTCTNTMFYARHGESDSPADLDIYSSDDQAQGTDINKMVQLGAGSDECGSGYLHIFNPSSTTFVKHFISVMSGYHPSDQNMVIHNAGYYNTTSALDRFQFKMTSGNIDAGDICLYGIA
jgi:hypothetical protein